MKNIKQLSENETLVNGKQEGLRTPPEVSERKTSTEKATREVLKTLQVTKYVHMRDENLYVDIGNFNIHLTQRTHWLHSDTKNI